MLSFNVYLVKKGYSKHMIFGSNLWKEMIRPSVKNDLVYKRHLIKVRILTLLVILGGISWLLMGLYYPELLDTLWIK